MRKSSIISASAAITICLLLLALNASVACVPPSSGLVAWWPGDGNANDIQGTNNGTLSGGASFVSGEVDQAFSFDGKNGTVNLNGPSLNGNASYTLAFWAKPFAYVQDSALVCFGANGVTDGAICVAMWSSGTKVTVAHYGDDHIFGQSWLLNQWQQVVVTYDSITRVESLYFNGNLSESWTPNHLLTLNSSRPMTFGRWAWGGQFYNGLLDEVQFFNRALSAAEIQTIYNAGSAGMCKLNLSQPSITQQPVSLTVTQGQPAVFSVVASGGSPLAYQWRFNEASLTGANSNSYALASAFPTNSGSYDVVVSNAWGSVTSAVATLTVLSVNGGLLGEYFNNATLEGTPVQRIEPVVDFDWGGTAPILGARIGSLFSAKWSGQIQPRYSENYTLTTDSDDGCRLWLDGRRLIDEWHGQTGAGSTHTATVQLEAGRRYALELAYFNGWCCGSWAHLYWQSSSQPKEIVPSSQLSPPLPGLNRPPDTPVINNPTSDSFVAAPRFDIPLSVDCFSDPDPGQVQAAADWEIYTTSPSNLVWYCYGSTGANMLTNHLGNGVFTNSHAGLSGLLPNIGFLLRVRHKDSSGATNCWSEWAQRVFNTANAGCDLRIISAGPCLADSDFAYGTPNVGDKYALKVVFRVVGTPLNPFRTKLMLANSTGYCTASNAVNGQTWTWEWYWTMDLDDAMPWTITVDPDGVSGDTNLANNVLSGTFIPTPPVTAVELYAPRMMSGFESSDLNFQPGSGTIPWIHVLAGVPSSHGAQSVLSVVGSTNATTVNTAPYGTPLFEVNRTNMPAAPIQIGERFTVQLSRVRVNPTDLRVVTWADMAGLSTKWTQWLAPDENCQSTNAMIINFVQESLPLNYRNSLTPYDTARTLHRAVMKVLIYQWPPSHGDAVGVLTDGLADCGGFSALLTACLRNVGIPARRILGFGQGTSAGHVRVEFHLPGCEWLVADPTYGNSNDASGTYAYNFGYVPSADSFLAVDVGDIHIMPYTTFGGIQNYGWWWWGGATYNGSSTVSYLQPATTLCVSSVAGGSIQLCLTNVPSQGTVVIESSTNLVSWLPVATNSANGNPLNYSFAISNRPKAFFRAVLAP